MLTQTNNLVQNLHSSLKYCEPKSTKGGVWNTYPWPLRGIRGTIQTPKNKFYALAREKSFIPGLWNKDCFPSRGNFYNITKMKSLPKTRLAGLQKSTNKYSTNFYPPLYLFRRIKTSLTSVIGADYSVRRCGYQTFLGRKNRLQAYRATPFTRLAPYYSRPNLNSNEGVPLFATLHTPQDVTLFLYVNLRRKHAEQALWAQGKDLYINKGFNLSKSSKKSYGAYFSGPKTTALPERNSGEFYSGEADSNSNILKKEKSVFSLQSDTEPYSGFNSQIYTPYKINLYIKPLYLFFSRFYIFGKYKLQKQSLKARFWIQNACKLFLIYIFGSFCWLYLAYYSTHKEKSKELSLFPMSGISPISKVHLPSLTTHASCPRDGMDLRFSQNPQLAKGHYNPFGYKEEMGFLFQEILFQNLPLFAKSPWVYTKETFDVLKDINANKAATLFFPSSVSIGSETRTYAKEEGLRLQEESKHSNQSINKTFVCKHFSISPLFRDFTIQNYVGTCLTPKIVKLPSLNLASASLAMLRKKGYHVNSLRWNASTPSCVANVPWGRTTGVKGRTEQAQQNRVPETYKKWMEPKNDNLVFFARKPLFLPKRANNKNFKVFFLESGLPQLKSSLYSGTSMVIGPEMDFLPRQLELLYKKTKSLKFVKKGISIAANSDSSSINFTPQLTQTEKLKLCNRIYTKGITQRSEILSEKFYQQKTRLLENDLLYKTQVLHNKNPWVSQALQKNLFHESKSSSSFENFGVTASSNPSSPLFLKTIGLSFAIPQKNLSFPVYVREGVGKSMAEITSFPHLVQESNAVSNSRGTRATQKSLHYSNNKRVSKRSRVKGSNLSPHSPNIGEYFNTKDSGFTALAQGHGQKATIFYSKTNSSKSSGTIETHIFSGPRLQSGFNFPDAPVIKKNIENWQNQTGIRLANSFKKDLLWSHRYYNIPTASISSSLNPYSKLKKGKEKRFYAGAFSHQFRIIRKEKQPPQDYDKKNSRCVTPITQVLEQTMEKPFLELVYEIDKLPLQGFISYNKNSGSIHYYNKRFYKDLCHSDKDSTKKALLIPELWGLETKTMSFNSKQQELFSSQGVNDSGANLVASTNSLFGISGVQPLNIVASGTRTESSSLNPDSKLKTRRQRIASKFNRLVFSVNPHLLRLDTFSDIKTLKYKNQRSLLKKETVAKNQKTSSFPDGMDGTPIYLENRNPPSVLPVLQNPQVDDGKQVDVMPLLAPLATHAQQAEQASSAQGNRGTSSLRIAQHREQKEMDHFYTGNRTPLLLLSNNVFSAPESFFGTPYLQLGERFTIEKLKSNSQINTLYHVHNGDSFVPLCKGLGPFGSMGTSLKTVFGKKWLLLEQSSKKIGKTLNSGGITSARLVSKYSKNESLSSSFNPDSKNITTEIGTKNLYNYFGHGPKSLLYFKRISGKANRHIISPFKYYNPGTKRERNIEDSLLTLEGYKKSRLFPKTMSYFHYQGIGTGFLPIEPKVYNNFIDVDIDLQSILGGMRQRTESQRLADSVTGASFKSLAKNSGFVNSLLEESTPLLELQQYREKSPENVLKKNKKYNKKEFTNCFPIRTLLINGSQKRFWRTLRPIDKTEYSSSGFNLNGCTRYTHKNKGLGQTKGFYFEKIFFNRTLKTSALNKFSDNNTLKKPLIKSIFDFLPIKQKHVKIFKTNTRLESKNYNVLLNYNINGTRIWGSLIKILFFIAVWSSYKILAIPLFGYTQFLPAAFTEAIGLKSFQQKFRIITREKTRQSFKNLAGAEKTLLELRDLIWTFRLVGTGSSQGENFSRSFPYIGSGAGGIKPRRSGVGLKERNHFLLVGPPGTGKTLLVKTLAAEANVPVIVQGVSGLKMITGVENPVSALFHVARQIKPCIIFLDELDTLGDNLDNPQNSGIKNSVTPEQKLGIRLARKYTYTLLLELDGLTSSTRDLLIIGATNRPETLNPALMRAGRFETIIHCNLPEEKGRRSVLSLYLSNSQQKYLNLAGWNHKNKSLGNVVSPNSNLTTAQKGRKINPFFFLLLQKINLQPYFTASVLANTPNRGKNILRLQGKFSVWKLSLLRTLLRINQTPWKVLSDKYGKVFPFTSETKNSNSFALNSRSHTSKLLPFSLVRLQKRNVKGIKGYSIVPQRGCQLQRSKGRQWFCSYFLPVQCNVREHSTAQLSPQMGFKEFEMTVSPGREHLNLTNHTSSHFSGKGYYREHFYINYIAQKCSGLSQSSIETVVNESALDSMLQNPLSFNHTLKGLERAIISVRKVISQPTNINDQCNLKDNARNLTESLVSSVRIDHRSTGNDKSMRSFMPKSEGFWVYKAYQLAGSLLFSSVVFSQCSKKANKFVTVKQKLCLWTRKRAEKEQLKIVKQNRTWKYSFLSNSQTDIQSLTLNLQKLYAGQASLNVYSATRPQASKISTYGLYRNPADVQISVLILQNLLFKSPGKNSTGGFNISVQAKKIYQGFGDASYSGPNWPMLGSASKRESGSSSDLASSRFSGSPNKTDWIKTMTENIFVSETSLRRSVRTPLLQEQGAKKINFFSSFITRGTNSFGNALLQQQIYRQVKLSNWFSTGWFRLYLSRPIFRYDNQEYIENKEYYPQNNYTPVLRRPQSINVSTLAHHTRELQGLFNSNPFKDQEQNSFTKKNIKIKIHQESSKKKDKNIKTVELKEHQQLRGINGQIAKQKQNANSDFSSDKQFLYLAIVASAFHQGLLVMQQNRELIDYCVYNILRYGGLYEFSINQICKKF